MIFKLVEEINVSTAQIANRVIKDAYKEFKSLSEDELIRHYRGQISKLGKNPMFITSKGDIIDVKEALDDFDTLRTRYITHNSYTTEILWDIIDNYIKDNNIVLDDYGNALLRSYVFDYSYDAVNYLVEDKGFIKVNPGNQSVDRRFYAVVPSINDKRPTDIQLDILEDFITLGEETHKEGILIYAGASSSHTYLFKDYTPSEIVKRIKRYYSSGVLYEATVNEVYPNKGESKKDFISRFMSVTKDEYPDSKQRYAIALSYWDRRNK